MSTILPPADAKDIDDAVRALGPEAVREYVEHHRVEATQDNWLREPSPFQSRDPRSIPPRDFLYGRHYIRKFVSLTASETGKGKSTLVRTEAVAMASGRDLLGVPVTRRRVWTVNLEDPLDEIDRGLIATCLHHDIPQSELEGWLWRDSGRELPLVVVQTVRGQPVVTPHVLELTEHLKRLRIDVLIIDPLIGSHEVAENDNTAIQVVAKAWAQVANDANCAVELIHHVRKVGVQNPSIEDTRGASSLLGATRSARRIVGMTVDEAERAGIEPGEAWRYSREGDGKENLAPPDRTRTWRRLVSVELGNGDHVGAMEAWTWPDAFSKVTVDDLQAAKEVVAGGEYRENAQAGEWWGKAVAEVLDLDLEDKHQRSQLRAILKTWLANGEFEVFEQQTGARQMKQFVRPIWSATPEDF